MMKKCCDIWCVLKSYQIGKSHPFDYPLGSYPSLSHGYMFINVPDDILLACCTRIKGKGKQPRLVWLTSVLVNSLWPSDAIWWYRSGLISVQVMVFCLMAPSHHLNQWWLIISEVLWHSREGNFIGNFRYKFEMIISRWQTHLPGVNELMLQIPVYQKVSLCHATDHICGWHGAIVWINSLLTHSGWVTHICISKLTIIVPPLQQSWKGGILVSPCPSVLLWTESYLFCIFNNTRRIHFILAHLIKQLQKVCHM